MPLSLANLTEAMNDYINVSDFAHELRTNDKVFIHALTQEYICNLIGIFNEVKFFEKGGVIQVYDILDIVILTHKNITELLQKKSLTKLSHMNIVKYVLEVLVYKLLSYPVDTNKVITEMVLRKSLVLLKTSPALKTGFLQKLFWTTNTRKSPHEILYHPIYHIGNADNNNERRYSIRLSRTTSGM